MPHFEEHLDRVDEFVEDSEQWHDLARDIEGEYDENSTAFPKYARYFFEQTYQVIRAADRLIEVSDSDMDFERLAKEYNRARLNQEGAWYLNRLALNDFKSENDQRPIHSHEEYMEFYELVSNDIQDALRITGEVNEEMRDHPGSDEVQIIYDNIRQEDEIIGVLWNDLQGRHDEDVSFHSCVERAVENY